MILFFVKEERMDIKKSGKTKSDLEEPKFIRGYGWNLVKTNPTKIFIGISGIIGAGKTTFSDQLSQVIGVPMQKEQVETNPYLDKFYDDMKQYSFSMQVHLLNERFEQHQKIIWGSGGAIQDRTIYEDPIFAKMLFKKELMSSLDYATYMALFQNMLSFVRKPNLIVYLDVSVETAMERIRKRGRECELAITEEYLTDLKRHYDEWCVEASTNVPVIKICWNENIATEEAYIQAMGGVAKKIEEICEKYRYGLHPGILIQGRFDGQDLVIE